jgi:hypothetical protein
MKEKDIHDLIEEAVGERNKHYLEFIFMRGVDYICPECSGLGVKTYPSTATWRGGIGGAAMTTDICNECWGSGDKYKHWVDLRALRNGPPQK